MRLPWDKLDVVTWSWQKALGGEAGHGMLALSPRAVERLESYTPPWPLPKLFRLTSRGKLIEGIFRGETINTPSMLCVEDAIEFVEMGRSRSAVSTGSSPRSRATSRRSPPGSSALLGALSGRGPGDPLLHLDPARNRRPLVCRAVARRPLQDRAVDDGAARGRGRGLRSRQPSRLAAGHPHLGRRDRRAADVEALLPWLDWAWDGADRKGAWSCAEAASTKKNSISGRRVFVVNSSRMPKVLIADALSPRAVEIFAARGIEADFATGLDRRAECRRIAGYDGLAVRSATKVTAELLAARRRAESGRPRRHRGRQHRCAGGDRARHRRDEHALRQRDHRRRAHDRDDVRAGPADPGRRPLDPGRQMAEIALYGGRAQRQDARHHRLRQYRRDRCRPRARRRDAGRRLRPVPVAGTRPRTRRRAGLARRALRPRRFHHAAHAADRRDAQHHRRPRARQDEARRAPHQLRARRARRRGRPRRRARQRPGRRRGDRCLRRGAGDAKPAVRARQFRRHAASRRRRPPRRRRTSRCRSPSRWPISC